MGEGWGRQAGGRTGQKEGSPSGGLGLGGGWAQWQIVPPNPMPCLVSERPTWASSVLRRYTVSTSLSSPIRAAWAQHRVRKPMFPYSEETLVSFPGPTGYSSAHFSAAVPLGVNELLDWAVGCICGEWKKEIGSH